MRTINVDYNGAIFHYQQLKNLFLKEYGKLAGLESADAENDFLEKVAQELNNESLNDEYNKAIDLLSNLGELYSDRQSLRQLRQHYEQLSNNSKMSGEKILDQITDELVSTEEFFKIVQDSISSYGDGFCSIDILNSARGYIKAFVKQRIVNKGTHNPKIAQRASSMKGYYREALIYKALVSVFASMENTPPVEIVSEGSKNTEVDTLIKFNEISMSELITENIGDSLNIGLQSKSWIEPWNEQGYYQSISNKAAVIYSVGNRANLLHGLDDKHSWIAGVNYLGQTNNIKAAIGVNNALYLTGKNIYFTEKLIFEMRQRAYYLAFVFDPQDYSATSQVTWQKRMDHVRWIQYLKNKKY